MISTFWGAAALSLALWSCGQDPAFVEKTFDNNISADSLPDDGTTKVMKFAFGRNSTPIVADYLFVLDNSVSMVKYSQKVAAGLAAIPASSFPESSKLAVMTTMAAVDPLAKTLIAHQDINRKDYPCIDSEPGFLELVQSTAVKRFKSCPGVLASDAAKYALDACDTPWFEPYAVNSSGERCFSAALQSPFHPVGCEAGLLAVEQMIKRQGDKPLFRANAAVNVIFVSDEQEGCAAAETRGVSSTAATLQQLIQSNSSVSSVKLHGIVPTSVSEGIRRYTSEIAATGGVFIPMQESRVDYRDVIQKIIESKVDLTSSDFDLGQTASRIMSVEIDGQSTDNFEFDGLRHVKIKDMDPARAVQVVIRFI